MDDPDTLKIQKAHDEFAKHPSLGAPFKPTGPSSGAPTPSIMFHVPGNNGCGA